MSVPSSAPGQPTPYVKVQRRGNFFGFSVPELLIVATAIITYGLYDLLGEELRSPGRMLWERTVSLGSYYIIALPVALLVLRLQHLRGAVPAHSVTWRIFRLNFLLPRRIFGDLRALFACVALFVIFIQLKHIVPFVHPQLFDSNFVLQEQRWFSGRLLSEWVLVVFGPQVAPLLSEGYFLFYPYVAVVIYLFVLQRNERLRDEFLTGFILCWLFGVALVFLLPTLGPCFVVDRFIDSLPSTGVQDMQIRLLRMREHVLQTRRGVNLISGFPSLHIAITLYGTILLWRLSRIASGLSLLVLGVTTITTLYFGWHYLLDNLGGALLAIFVARGVRRYYRPFFVLARR